MPHRESRRIVRVVGTVTGVFALFVTVGFVWFVLISWDVLREALGTAWLAALLAVAALTIATWGSMFARRLRYPQRGVSRRGGAGLVAVSLLAVVCGAVAVPLTRARLETNKCRRLAPAEPAAQRHCHDRLEARRQWWTFGLSHQNG